MNHNLPVRINKYLAEHGIATRRNADLLIADGRVFINGKKAHIGQKVEATDKVEVKDPTPQNRVYVAYHKPRGIISHSPQDGETAIPRTIALHGKQIDVFPVGRLDKDSSGLIILTNDGRITDRLLNPNYEHSKTYAVEVDKKITNHFIKWIERGVKIENDVTRPATVKQIHDRLCEITLTEGKKHQIRRMCAALGYQVVRLTRISIEHIQLGSIAPGTWKEITGKTLETFLKKLGL